MSAPPLSSLDGPVRALLERIAAPAALAEPDLPAVGDALTDFARDLDYLRRWIDAIDPAGGGARIHAPERGPRLQIVNRPEGEMGPVHDHRVWVALATITGVETHRRYRRPARTIADGAGKPGRAGKAGRAVAMPELAETVDLSDGQVVTMLPPDDIHDHGHLVGHGRPAYILVLTGDDQRRYERNEWDLATGRHRILRPGQGGRFLASDPWPEG